MQRNEIIKNIIIALSIVGIGAGFWAYQQTARPQLAPISESTRPKSSRTRAQLQDATVTVYVVGAVQNPGLYPVPDGSRVADAISKAGGFTSDADWGSINMAAKCKDGARIAVKKLKTTRLANTEIITQTHLNAASTAELRLVPGIGPKLAKDIVAYRDEHGAFAHVSDLAEIRGMKPKTLAKIEPYLTL